MTQLNVTPVRDGENDEEFQNGLVTETTEVAQPPTGDVVVDHLSKVSDDWCPNYVFNANVLQSAISHKMFTALWMRVRLFSDIKNSSKSGNYTYCYKDLNSINMVLKKSVYCSTS